VSGPALAQAQVAHLAFADQVGHGADRLLDGRGRVNALQVVEIDALDAEAFQ